MEDQRQELESLIIEEKERKTLINDDNSSERHNSETVDDVEGG